MKLLTDEEKIRLLVKAVDRWKLDPNDQELIRLFCGVIICETLTEVGVAIPPSHDTIEVIKSECAGSDI
jgi:hypothetical protein